MIGAQFLKSKRWQMLVPRLVALLDPPRGQLSFNNRGDGLVIQPGSKTPSKPAREERRAGRGVDRRMRIAQSLGLVLLLAGCASPGVHPLRPHDLAVAPYQETITSALTGSLMYEGGCLLFRDEATTAHLLPVWPLGSTFNGTSVIFHEPGKPEQRVLVGEEFVMSGQPIAWSALAAPTSLPFHNQCNVEPFFVSGVRPAN